MFGKYMRYVYLKKMANIFLAVSQHVTSSSLKQALGELHSEGVSIRKPEGMKYFFRQSAQYIFIALSGLLALYLLLAMFTNISRNQITSAVWGVPLLETFLFILPIGGLYRYGNNKALRVRAIAFKALSLIMFLFYYAVHFMTYCYPLLPNMIAYGWALYYLMLIIILVYPLTKTEKILDGVIISLFIHVVINTVITVLQSI